MKAIKVYAKYVSEVAKKFGLQYISKENYYYDYEIGRASCRERV